MRLTQRFPGTSLVLILDFARHNSKDRYCDLWLDIEMMMPLGRWRLGNAAIIAAKKNATQEQ